MPPKPSELPSTMKLHPSEPPPPTMTLEVAHLAELVNALTGLVNRVLEEKRDTRLLVTIDELSVMCSVSKSVIRQWAANRIIHRYQLGAGKLLFAPAEVMKDLNRTIKTNSRL